ncbi:MAG: hypothetical protein KA277_03460 [Fusobacteriaceae bacterium]|jgi:hypothetical protein|nr:hypothetical protein [Fusobacteriaceae bacterium]
MKINIVDVQNMLSNQDYLEFDKLLTKMYTEQNNNNKILILKEAELIKTLITFDDIEEWKKRMVQIYGLHGFI